MRLIAFEHNNTRKIGALTDNGVADLSACAPELPSTIKELLEQGKVSAAQEALEKSEDASLSLDEITLLAPIEDAEKIICIGRNYAAHAKEGGVEPPSYPEIFMRSNRSLIAHEASIVRPKCSDKLDYEGELVLIIGKKARHVAEEDALDFIGGYSIFNEATLRDYQRKSTQWTIGKNFDNTGAFGPCIVTPDELPEGAKGLRIQTRLNGQTMQDANTDDLIFTIPNLIARLSECLTLMPGDVIVTGTPAGVGYARTPPVWMKPGDLCEIEIEGIGILKNSIVDEA